MAPPVLAAAAKAALKEEARRRAIDQAKRPRTILIILGLALAPIFLLVVGVIFVASMIPNSSNGAAAEGVEIAGIPTRATAAYQAYGDHCPGLDWTLLAAVGAVESNHGQNGLSDIDNDTGEALPWIFGPDLSGSGGTAAIPIGRWVGWWGLTGPWMQAVGPMQFLPPTFETHAIDGSGDGETNPHQIDDAVATTANYLCSAGGEEIDGVNELARIYNPGSPTYADELRAAQEDILDALPQATTAGGTGTATTCPIAGPVELSDTWGAPRSGGRSHEGDDMFAPHGTPVVAPEAGTVEHYNNSLGGLSYRLYGDTGTATTAPTSPPTRTSAPVTSQPEPSSATPPAPAPTSTGKSTPPAAATPPTPPPLPTPCAAADCCHTPRSLSFRLPQTIRTSRAPVLGPLTPIHRPEWSSRRQNVQPPAIAFALVCELGRNQIQ